MLGMENNYDYDTVVVLFSIMAHKQDVAGLERLADLVLDSRQQLITTFYQSANVYALAVIMPGVEDEELYYRVLAELIESGMQATSQA